MEFLLTKIKENLNEQMLLLTISNPRKTEEIKKYNIRPVLVKAKLMFQSAAYTKTQVDMVVTLHACDTATDYAMYKALRWGASVILSVPCCQHELNKQIAASEFEPITDYGILKERFCALATDGIRAKILEEQGYDTQILEFIDMEHTPKNLLIRAIHRKKQSDKKKEKAAQQVDAFCKQFGFTPTLWRLLQEEGEEGGTHDE